MKLNVYTYKAEKNMYSFDRKITITGEFSDADWNRWAMLNDGDEYRLYCFRRDSKNTIYQFGYDKASDSYKLGHNSIPEIKLENVPDDANTYAFAMLQDGEDYRLYLGSYSKPDHIFQAVWNKDEEKYVFNPELTMHVEGLSETANPYNIAMLHSDDAYRFYTMDENENLLHQAEYVPIDNAYETINSIPVDSPDEYLNGKNYSMVYGEDTYWFYTLDKE